RRALRWENVGSNPTPARGCCNSISHDVSPATRAWGGYPVAPIFRQLLNQYGIIPFLSYQENRNMSNWPSSISNQLIQKASSSSLGTTIASLAPAQPEYGLTSVIRDLSKELEASLE